MMQAREGALAALRPGPPLAVQRMRMRPPTCLPRPAPCRAAYAYAAAYLSAPARPLPCSVCVCGRLLVCPGPPRAVQRIEAAHKSQPGPSDALEPQARTLRGQARGPPPEARRLSPAA